MKSLLGYLCCVLILCGCAVPSSQLGDLLSNLPAPPSSNATPTTPEEAVDLVALPPSPTPDLPLMSEEEIAEAVAVYRDAYCGACHTLTIAGTRGIFAPNHDSMGILAEARLQDPGYQGAAQTPADYIRESILEPRAYIEDAYQVTHHPMPAYSHLSPDAIEAMVTLLLIQREEMSGD